MTQLNVCQWSGKPVCVCHFSLERLQAKKAKQLHDDKVAMAKTLAENDANIKAKKKAAKQQVPFHTCILHGPLRAIQLASSFADQSLNSEPICRWLIWTLL